MASERDTHERWIQMIEVLAPTNWFWRQTIFKVVRYPFVHVMTLPDDGQNVWVAQKALPGSSRGCIGRSYIGFWEQEVSSEHNVDYP